MSSSSGGGTAVNAVVGGIVTVLLAFVPGWPVAGGAVAAYLQNGTRREGVVVGALSGVVVTVPAVGLVLLLATVFPVRSDVGGAVGVPLGPLLSLLVAVLVMTAYFVGLGAVGGYLGVLVREWRAG